MKYNIEQLLKDEDVSCHEVRGTKYNGKDILLHFFITKKDSLLPKFKMGYEIYNSLNIEDKIKEEEFEKHNPIQYALINNTDKISILYGNIHLQKNEWTGEKVDPVSPENISVQTEVRYVNEMADNSIYHTEIAERQEAIFDEQVSNDSQISDSKKEMIENELRDSHSIWKTKYHFDKFSECSNKEMIELFEKYLPYVNREIPSKLDTEDKLNIDMESIFGKSFDMLRIKNKMMSPSSEKPEQNTFP